MRSVTLKLPSGLIPRLLSKLAWPAILSLFLAACFKPDEQKTAGVDDFPNSVQARVNRFLEESRKSGEIAAVPPVTGEILGRPGFHVGAAKVGLLKASVGSTPLSGLAKASADTACSGTLKFDTTTITAPTKATVNSLTLCEDANLPDSTKGNKTVLHGSSVTTFLSGRVESAEITDADGDGKLNPVAGKASKARMILTATEAGITERTVLLVGPGPDNDFDTEKDNLVYEAAWTKTGNGGKDTLGTAVYTDADGDGVAVDNGKPSTVDLDLYQKGPTTDHPDAVWSRIRMRMVTVYGVDAKEAKRVHFEMAGADGRIQSADLLNKDGGRDFVMSDTLQAHFLAVGASAQDTVDTMETTLIMKVGKDLDDKSDDSVYAMDVRVVKKLGEEKSARFAFKSDRPIPSGQKPASGTVSMKIDYGDGSSLEVDGKLSGQGLDVLVKNRDGKRQNVVWDPLGRGVTLETVP